MDTLKPTRWLGGSILDYALLVQRLQMKKTIKCYLLGSHVTVDLATSDKLEECQVSSIRRQNGLSARGPLPKKPVVLVILHANHYFVVVFNYSSGSVHVLGQSGNHSGYTNEIGWENWRGCQLWTYVAKLFGWKAKDPVEAFKSGYNWLQVCYEIDVISNNHLTFLFIERSRLWTNGLFHSNSTSFSRSSD